MYHETMQEAAQFQMPSELQQLFATILLFGEPSNTHSLWNNNFAAMSEDFAKKGIPDNYLRINAVLLQIKHYLEYHDKSLSEYDLPPLISPDNNLNESSKLLLNELNISITAEDLSNIELLNKNQKIVFNTIIEHIEKNQPATIFIDGPAAENSSDANEFKDFLLRIGNGTEQTVEDHMICIPDNMIIKWCNEESLQTLIKSTFPFLKTYTPNISYFTNRVILTTKNEHFRFCP
ncbi:6416_t:CDS:2 [Cetraspora pellucida]|uniref:6416_t:CDS:1 n=1 Tax=Cetraspora pellucida TaxID=1433469 RepID=A0ACA9KE14_9GLOM|nr:6416_t:CDS:2 [Cetraspora pellucida]